MGDVLLETRAAYLSLKGTSHSLVRTRHSSRSAPRAAPGLSVCRQPSARAEIHSPPGPTGCSLDRAPLPAFPVPGLSGSGG